MMARTGREPGGDQLGGHGPAAPRPHRSGRAVRPRDAATARLAEARARGRARDVSGQGSPDRYPDRDADRLADR
jgi:hypothetical protein